MSLASAPGARVGDGGPDSVRDRGERGDELPDDSLDTEQLRGLTPFSAAEVAGSLLGTNITDTQLSSESRLVSLWKLFSLELSELSSREVRRSREANRYMVRRSIREHATGATGLGGGSAGRGGSQRSGTTGGSGTGAGAAQGGSCICETASAGGEDSGQVTSV